MTTTFLQRSIIIFAVLLCCFQCWVSAVDCELYPYHTSCRGVMTKKRTAAPNILRTLECDDGDCRLPRMKFLIALLDDNLTRDNGYDYYPPDYNTHHRKRKTRYNDRRPIMENLMAELKNTDSDY